MRNLLATLLKYLMIFLIIVGGVWFVGYKYRSRILPYERYLQPKVDKALIMMKLKEDTTGYGMRRDTTLTPAEEFDLEIRSRMEELQTRTHVLDSLQQVIAAREDSIATARNQLVSRQVELTRTEDANLAKLALLYAAMKPAQAAQIFLQLPDQTAIAILSRMDDRSAGKLIEALGDPVRSADILDRYSRMQATVKNDQ